MVLEVTKHFAHVYRSEGHIEKKQQQQTEKKYDLAKWKYADLRDTINTSCGE